MLLLARSVIDSWTFPWYGNPDQDLVFLRDGFRLWSDQSPGYGDHPGLMQMLVVALALSLLSLLAHLGFPWVFDTLAPADADWQLLFVASKLVNALLMSLLLVGCTFLLMRWLGRPAASVWGVMCAVSMALVAETYQLRNEFFSAFMAVASMLIAVSGADFWYERSHEKKVDGARNDLLFIGACVGSFALSFSSVLAKVQVLPVLLAFAIAVFVASFACGSRRFKVLFAQALLVFIVAQLLVANRLYGGGELMTWQFVVVVLAVAVPPSLVVATFLSSAPAFSLARLASGSVSLAACIVLASTYLNFSQRAEWLGLLGSPASVRSYAVNADGCLREEWSCYGGGGVKGIAYLFERSVDSYLLAPIIAIVVCFGVCFCLVRLSWRRAQAMDATKRSGEWVSLGGCLCIAIALGMAVLAGQRWAVDHYLAYQQPFLFAGLLLLARRSAPIWRMWRVLVVMIAISLVLIFLRYPEGSRETYVKEDITVAPEAKIGDGLLCAAQHAGPEWQSSSLWRLCQGFSR